jgi:hypothetical protein
VKRVILLFLILNVLAVHAQDTLTQSSLPRKVPLMTSASGRALQSAAVPGLGQALQREWLRGGVFFAGASFLAADALHFWESQYDRAGSDQAGRIYDRDTAYGLAVWYGVSALFAAADAGYTASRSRETNPTWAAFKSILFPGWGQLSNGKHWKAMGIFALQTSVAFGIFTQHEHYIFYNALNQPSTASFYKNDRNRLVWWSAGIAILSALDAFVDCHLRDWNVSEELSWAPYYSPESRSTGLSLNLALR